MEVERKKQTIHSKSTVQLGFVCPKCRWYQTARVCTNISFDRRVRGVATMPKMDYSKISFDCPRCGKPMKQFSWYMIKQISKLMDYLVYPECCETTYDKIEPSKNNEEKIIVHFPKVVFEGANSGLLGKYAEELAKEPEFEYRIRVCNENLYDDLTPSSILVAIDMYGSGDVSYSSAAEATAARADHRKLFLSFLDKLIEKLEEAKNDGN